MLGSCGGGVIALNLKRAAGLPIRIPESLPVRHHGLIQGRQTVRLFGVPLECLASLEEAVQRPECPLLTRRKLEARHERVHVFCGQRAGQVLQGLGGRLRRAVRRVLFWGGGRQLLDRKSVV